MSLFLCLSVIKVLPGSKIETGIEWIDMERVIKFDRQTVTLEDDRTNFDATILELDDRIIRVSNAPDEICYSLNRLSMMNISAEVKSKHGNIVKPSKKKGCK